MVSRSKSGLRSFFRVYNCLEIAASRDSPPRSRLEKMNVHFSYKVHKTPDIEKEINHQLEKIQKRLQVFRPELVHLKGVVDQNSAREGIAGVVESALAIGTACRSGESVQPNRRGQGRVR